MRKDAKIFIGIGILTVIIVLVAAFTIGSKPVEERETLGESELKTLYRKDTHTIKSPDAKVTIVEFGDFQCPACGVAHTITKKIKTDYKGKINFAFREFPLVTAHKNAYIAALAAEAAGGQNKFWEMHDKLFENQDEWNKKDNPLDIFAAYAKTIGINVDKFKKDVNNKTYDKKIQNDINDGTRLGVNSTPTFYINGKQNPGVLTYDNFKNLIENEIKN